MQGDRCGSIYFLLHDDIQLNQDYMLKMFSFSHAIILAYLLSEGSRTPQENSQSQ